MKRSHPMRPENFRELVGASYPKVLPGDDGLDGEVEFAQSGSGRPQGLLARLLVRAGVNPPPPVAAPQAPKRPRGRPRKVVPELASMAAGGVSEGQGAVLADGVPGEVPEALQ